MEGAGGYSGNLEEGTGGAQRNPQHQAAQKRLQQTQAKVDEVVGIMQINVRSLMEREQRLAELDDRADALQQGASQFEQQAGKLKRKYWWKNLKMMLILGGIAVVILVIIIVWATSASSGSGSSNSAQPSHASPATFAEKPPTAIPAPASLVHHNI